MSSSPLTSALGITIMNSHVQPSVVQYIGQYFLFMGLNQSGKARLLRPDLTIYSGTPLPSKLKVIKPFEVRTYNGHTYVSTKQGVISCATGRKIIDKNILNLFS